MVHYIYAKSTRDFAVCPKCERITQTVYDSRCQFYKHLPTWCMGTVIVLTKRRFVCDCDIEHPFDEQFEFIRKYQCQTVPYEKYVFTITYKNTIKNASDILGISECKCQGI
jgi:hypothetical protein